MKLRERLWEAGGRKGHWCQRDTRLTTEIAPDQATIDHVVPRGQGGSSDCSNCVSACSGCNDARNREDQRANGPTVKRKKQQVDPVTPLQLQLRRQRESEDVLREQLKQFEQMSVRAFAFRKLGRWLHGIELRLQPQTSAPDGTQDPSA